MDLKPGGNRHEAALVFAQSEAFCVTVWTMGMIYLSTLTRVPCLITLGQSQTEPLDTGRKPSHFGSWDQLLT